MTVLDWAFLLIPSYPNISSLMDTSESTLSAIYGAKIDTFKFDMTILVFEFVCFFNIFVEPNWGSAQFLYALWVLQKCSL